MQASELPQELFAKMEGNENVPDDFVFDGCSCAPDEFGAIDLRCACCVHDHDYYMLRSFSVDNFRSGILRADSIEIIRKRRDQRFYRNLITSGLSVFMAGIYYRRVRMHGVDAVYGSSSVYPDGLLSRRARLLMKLKIFFSRYIPVW